MSFKTGKKLWDTEDGREAYLIGYFPNPQTCMKVMKEMRAKYGIAFHVDIRLVGIARKQQK